MKRISIALVLICVLISSLAMMNSTKTINGFATVADTCNIKPCQPFTNTDMYQIWVQLYKNGSGGGGGSGLSQATLDSINKAVYYQGIHGPVLGIGQLIQNISLINSENLPFLDTINTNTLKTTKSQFTGAGVSIATLDSTGNIITNYIASFMNDIDNTLGNIKENIYVLDGYQNNTAAVLTAVEITGTTHTDLVASLNAWIAANVALGHGIIKYSEGQLTAGTWVGTIVYN